MGDHKGHLEEHKKPYNIMGFQEFCGKLSVRELWVVSCEWVVILWNIEVLTHLKVIKNILFKILLVCTTVWGMRPRGCKLDQGGLCWTLRRSESSSWAKCQYVRESVSPWVCEFVEYWGAYAPKKVGRFWTDKYIFSCVLSYQLLSFIFLLAW